MTVSSETSRKSYAGNGATTSFSTSPMVFFDSSDLVVYAVNNTTGVVTTLAETTDYTVTGGSGSIGTVSTLGLYGAPASGVTLVISRVLPVTQESDFVNNDGSDAEVVEDALDRLTMIAQEHDSRIDRTVRLADSDPVSVTLTLPSAVERAGTYLSFDTSGNVSCVAGTPTDVWSLTHPNSTSAAYDSAPEAAIHIQEPAAATTRAFSSGIWVETNGASVDKGRGILVNNYGASDGVYVQCDGASGTGYAGYASASATSATVAVFSTLLSTQTALALRQETSISATANGVLLKLTADGAVTEMAQINSTKNTQVGFMFRFTGSGAKPIVIKNPSDTTVWAVDNDGYVTSANGGWLYNLTAMPAGGTADVGLLFSTTAHFGMFFGSGAPALSAAKGSLYLRSNGSTTNDRAYINTDGGTTWTALTTAA